MTISVVMRLRSAVGYPASPAGWGPPYYEPDVDALIRRLAEQLPPALVDDVAQLALLAQRYISHDCEHDE